MLFWRQSAPMAPVAGAGVASNRDNSMQEHGRRFLKTFAAVGIGAPGARVGAQARRPPLADPFMLGVASGYPTPDGAVLWTRLLADPARGDGGLLPVPIAVRWELAADQAFARIVAQGAVEADPAWAHSVHVEPAGLASGRWYWYRFVVDGMPERFRFAFASCQIYEHGYFGAYRQAVRDELDLMVFLGDYDYIYDLDYYIDRFAHRRLGRSLGKGCCKSGRRCENRAAPSHRRSTGVETSAT